MLETGASFTDGDLADPFFTNVAHRGAFGTDDWTLGWCSWNPQTEVY
jgi:hypothetical protein